MDTRDLVERAAEARKAGQLTDPAFQNVKRWLEEEAFSEFRGEIGRWIEKSEFEKINDSFGAVLPFGTGGRRGPVGIGPNRINARTIGESAQGVANYLLNRWKGDDRPSVAIASDTRLTSPEFTQLTAEVFAGNGLNVFLFDGPRSTPELSFAVRYLRTDLGVVISASHNPPGDNGFKVYGTDGAQIVPPVDSEIIAEVEKVGEIKRLDLKRASIESLFRWIGTEVDEAYWNRLAGLALVRNRKGIDIVFTPLHGTGLTSVKPALEKIGRDRLRIVEAQATPDGNFPNVAGHKPNPEEPKALEMAIAEAKERRADLVLATDPDADRLGVAVRRSADGNEWVRFNGNQIGALLTFHVLREMDRDGGIPDRGLVAKTLVTTAMISDICESYGVEVRTDLLVGFKYIGEVINRDLRGHEDRFILGAEESHGYLRGTFVRDKDAAGAAVTMAELTAVLKEEGKTPYDLLQDLYRRYGYYLEELQSVFHEGEEGLRTIQEMMKGFRERPPREFGGARVFSIEDYSTGRFTDPASGKVLQEISRPRGDLLIFRLSNDGRNWLAVRPSGTEPKIKFYLSVYEPVPADADLEAVKRAAAERAKKIWDSVPRA